MVLMLEFDVNLVQLIRAQLAEVARDGKIGDLKAQIIITCFMVWIHVIHKLLFVFFVQIAR